MSRVVAVGICAVLLGACAGQTQVRYPEVTSSPTTTLTLLDAGAEPRRVLTIQPAVGQTQRVRIASQQRGQNVLGGQPGVDTGDIATRVDVNVTATNRRQDGATSLAYFYDTAGADPDVEMTDEIVDNIATSNQPLVGKTLDVVLSPNGTVRTAAFANLESVSETDARYLQQVADQLTTYQSALPDQPVGLGGSWRTSVTLTINDISVTTTTTYTIRSLNQNQMTLDVDVSQTPNGTTFNVNSQKVDVLNWDVSGRGIMKIAFDKPLPVRYEIQLNGQQTLKFGGLLDAEIVNTINTKQTISQLD